MHSDFLNWLLAPASVPAFWRDHWEKEFLVVHRDSPSYFRDVLGLEDIDRLLSYVKIPITHFDLSKDSSPIPKESYCIGSEIDIQKALAQHREGATIILNGAHDWCEPLQRLRLAAETTFLFPAHVGLWLTPPETPSTTPHWDTHDLFILQIEGAKRWRIYEASYMLPLANETFIPGVQEVGPLRCEFMVRAGDVLYLPRGTIHGPQATEYSVHATLGVHVTRWADVLTELIRVASENNVELRQAIPLASGRQGRVDVSEIVPGVAHRLPTLNDPHAVEQAVERIVRQFIETRDMDVSGHLLATAKPRSLSGATTVRRRRGVCYRMNRDSTKTYMHWRTKTIEMPLHLEPAMRFITERDVFCIRDLPGGLSDDEKIATVSTLIDEGFLQEQSDGATDGAWPGQRHAG